MADERQCNECGGKLPADAPQGLCPQCLMKLGLPSEAGGEDHALSDDHAAIPTSATPPGGFVPLEPAELAKKFPQLEILELLGQGGMGAVYKARQKQLDRLVALKILPPEVGRDPAFAERFSREARSLARLNHPGIVSVFDFGRTEDGLYYFIMEFVDGTDLRRVIEGGQLDPVGALAIVPQICEALQYAHEEGLVHRDIKPENILLDKKGRVKIADFGLAKLLGKPATAYTLTQAGQRMGTPHYMAPEQIEGAHEVDHRADIYSLGVVFYEMLTGELPIGRFSPPSKKVQVDVRLDEIVLHTLEKEPELRYQHASEVKTDVESIAHTPARARDITPRHKEQASIAAGRMQPESTEIRQASSSLWPSIMGSLWLLAAAVVFLGQTVQRHAPTMVSFSSRGAWCYQAYYDSIVILCGAVGSMCYFTIWCTSRRNLGRRQSLLARKLAGTASSSSWFIGHLWLLAFVILYLGRKAARNAPTMYQFFGLGRWLRPFTYNAPLWICMIISGLCFLWAWRKANAGLDPVQGQTGQTQPPAAAYEVFPSKELHQPDQHANGIEADVETICAGSEPPRPDAKVMPEVDIQAVRQDIRIPAIGLMVAGALNALALIPFVVIMGYGAFTGGRLINVLLGSSSEKEEGVSALCFGIACLGTVVIFGALKMRELKGYWAALLGAILAAVPVTPGALVGLPAGIWALAVLTRREVKAAFPQKAGAAERRFSRAAIVGAFLSPLGLLLLPVIAVLLIPELGEKSRNLGLPLIGLYEVIVMVVLCVSAVFGTTILGIVAITHIRQSAGRLYGMGLALFDALLFPVLALNIGIVAVLVLAGMDISEVVILTLIIGGLLDFFLIRRAWRKANAGLEPEQKHARQTKTDAKAQ